MTLLAPDISKRLHNLLGDDGFSDSEADCRAMASDVFYATDKAVAVIAPQTVDALCVGVAAVTDAGFAVVPRGGGMSYTGGYTPHDTAAVIVDTAKLDAIVEINADDMYATVEAGCTWASLDEALERHGLRTPFWGPFSGRFATVGGGISQNSIFWGAGRYGSAADSVLGLDVVTADGSLLRTGSGGHTDRTPFFRHYGPDLTGLFTADTGALGIKARVTLRLIERPTEMGQLAFELAEPDKAVAAVSALARSGLAAEIYGFDPAMTSIRMRRRNITEDAAKLMGVVKKSGSLVDGLKKGAKLALSGRPSSETDKYTLYVNCEENTAAGLKDVMARCTDIVISIGGTAVDAAVPVVVRANPFLQSGDTLGPEGQCWVPVHAILPHSAGPAALADLDSLLETYRERMDAAGVEHGTLLASISTNGLVLEPVFYWHDRTPPPLRRILETSDNLKAASDNAAPETTHDLVAELRTVCLEALRRHGAVHLQAGRFYDPAGSMQKESRELLTAIKKHLDPRGRMNPGSLGL